MKKSIILITFLFFSTILSAQCWLEIDAGCYHTLGIKQDGTLWAWGFNATGQFGNGTTTNSSSPIQVGTENNWLKVSAGCSYSLAIKTNGTLWAWGLNSDRQLGDGTTITRTSPVQIGTATNWLKIEAGNQNSIALKNDGSIWSWGLNDSGQLGLGNYTNKSNPTQVGTDTNWVSVSTYSKQSAALKSNGTLWAWGRNNNGQIGDGTLVVKPSPVQIGILSTWQAFSLISGAKLALKTDGTLWACGSNFSGELGIGISGGGYANLTQVGSDTNWQKIYGGQDCAKAIKNDGSMWAWGTNGGGIFGNNLGGEVTSNIPVLISNDSWNYISIGVDYSINIKDDGSLWVCGRNNVGQLGNGVTSQITSYFLSQINCPGSLGLEENEQNKTFALYPNPAIDRITIMNKGFQTPDKISIIDLTGKELKVTYNAENIDIEKLSAGIYILEIQFEGKLENHKFIKQ
jgi:alpha-tubulin suppressor-like RCC1 family protein